MFIEVMSIKFKIYSDFLKTFYIYTVTREQVSLFKSGTLTAEIDNDDDTIFAELLGKTVDEETGVVTSNSEDTPIYVGFGHIVPKMVGRVKKYKVEFFPKIKFKPFITDAKTKGDNLEFTTPSVEATIFENDNGDWEKHSVCDTETEANTLLASFFVSSSQSEEGE